MVRCVVGESRKSRDGSGSGGDGEGLNDIGRSSKVAIEGKQMKKRKWMENIEGDGLMERYKENGGEETKNKEKKR